VADQAAPEAYKKPSAAEKVALEALAKNDTSSAPTSGANTFFIMQLLVLRV